MNYLIRTQNTLIFRKKLQSYHNQYYCSAFSKKKKTKQKHCLLVLVLSISYCMQEVTALQYFLGSLSSKWNLIKFWSLLMLSRTEFELKTSRYNLMPFQTITGEVWKVKRIRLSFNLKIDSLINTAVLRRSLWPP